MHWFFIRGGGTKIEGQVAGSMWKPFTSMNGVVPHSVDVLGVVGEGPVCGGGRDQCVVEEGPVCGGSVGGNACRNGIGHCNTSLMPFVFNRKWVHIVWVRSQMKVLVQRCVWVRSQMKVLVQRVCVGQVPNEGVGAKGVCGKGVCGSGPK